MKCLLLLITLSIFSIGCNNEQLTNAKIFERRHQAGDRLVIKFKYEVDSKVYVDSATIANMPLKGDTIAIKYKKSSPEKATPQLEK